MNSTDIFTWPPYPSCWNDVEKNARRTAFMLFSVLGIIFNLFIITLAAKYTVRKSLHHLIINMAVSDIIFLLVQLSIEIPALRGNFYIYTRGTLGAVLCKSQMFLLHVSFRVSLITLLVISIERFKVTRRMHISQPYTLKKRVAILAVTWLIPMAFAAVYSYYAEVPKYNDHVWYEPICRSIIKAGYIFSFFASLPALIACLVIIVLSILTSRRLSNPQGNIQAHLSEEQRSMRISRTRAAVRMVLVSIVLYICCMFLFLVDKFNRSVNNEIRAFQPTPWDLYFCDHNKGFVIVSFLPVLNSCFSPCIYIIFLSDFREAAKKLLCRRQALNHAANRANDVELQPVSSRVTGPTGSATRQRSSSDEG